MGFMKPKQTYTPAPEAAAPPPNAPSASDASVAQAGVAARGSAATTGPRGQGLNSTIMTSSRGILEEPATAKKTLLGQ